MKTEHVADKAQEWTGQMVWEILGNPCESLLACERLAVVINASIAAERELTGSYKNALELAESQLTAENGRLRKMWEGGMIELERQLSAERSKVKELEERLKSYDEHRSV